VRARKTCGLVGGCAARREAVDELPFREPAGITVKPAHVIRRDVAQLLSSKNFRTYGSSRAKRASAERLSPASVMV